MASSVLQNLKYLTGPDWYCPKIPSDFTGAVQPLVYISGLEIESNTVHRGIWEVIKSKPGTKDFQPTYVNVSLNHKFPVKKEKNEPIETYAPVGMVKSNWLQKHLQQVPSVVVVCFYIDWSEQYWNDKKTECANKIKELKAELAPHGSQILVMLIKAVDSKEENFSTDRATSLCAAADIPPKALYILAHTHNERVQACIARLELGMKEASKLYYSSRVRRVKNLKERTNNQILMARYSFKTAVFQEIRRDYFSALSAYMLTQDILRTIKFQDFYAQQLRTVASWVNYRICRLHLMKQEYIEANSHFERHIRHFQRRQGNSNVEFEYHAYLQQQYCYFGELLRHYYTVGRSSLDPTTYLLLAVNQSVKREEKMKALVTSLGEIKESNIDIKYISDCPVDYIGQRPWRLSGEFLPDSATETESQEGVLILNYIEQRHDHSTDRINHYGIASDFCRDLKRTRTRCEMMMMMGHEFNIKKEFHRCIILMTHVLKEFGRDKLTELLFVVGDTGLKASWCDGDVTSYLSFLIFHLKQDFAAKLGEARRKSLWANFVAALEKKIPSSPVDGVNIDCKEDVWKLAMEKPYVSYVVVHKEPIVDAVFYFVNETFRAATRAEIRVVLKNRSEFPIDIQKCGVVISITEYNTDTPLKLTLQPGDSHELSLYFPLMVRDTGKVIQIQMGYLDIGKPDASVLLHYSALIESNPYLWNDGKKDVRKQIITKIDPMLPLLTPKVAFEFFPMLTNSIQKVDITWTNTDVHKYTKLNLMCRLECPELEDLFIATEPNVANGKLKNMGLITELDELGAGESKQVSVFINSRKPRNDIQITTKAKYVDGNGQIVTNDSVEPIEVIDPFSVSWQFLNSQFEPIQDASPHEPFMLKFTIKNVSHQSLQLRSMDFKLTSNAYVESGTAQPFPPFLTLKAKEVFQFLNAYSSQYPTDLSLGDLCILWNKFRYNQDDPRGLDIPFSPLMSKFTVNPLPVSQCTIFVETIVSGKGMGELKKPVPIKYAITNCTEKVLDLCASLESSDSFMNAGPKKINVKLISRGTAQFQYVLFPLKTGLLLTPRLVFEQPNASGDNRVQPVVQRNVIKNIFVSRAEGGEENGIILQPTLT
ncbi:unnamed protein product [Orchesella dallaii]|uniref:Trafficking protein particle complex subunit 11 n=1 Tax=Orchesella dallaii TaxID=48710 RepID=A0ABP1R575_9HEXA